MGGGVKYRLKIYILKDCHFNYNLIQKNNKYERIIKSSRSSKLQVQQTTPIARKEERQSKQKSWCCLLALEEG